MKFDFISFKAWLVTQEDKDTVVGDIAKDSKRSDEPLTDKTFARKNKLVEEAYRKAKKKYVDAMIYQFKKEMKRQFET